MSSSFVYLFVQLLARSGCHAQGARVEQLAAVEGLAASNMPQRPGEFTHQRDDCLALVPTIAFDLALVPGGDHRIGIAPAQRGKIEILARLAWAML